MSLLEELGEAVQKDVAKAKDNGCAVQHINLGTQDFIYRSLNRLEWKILQKATLEGAQGPDGAMDPVKLMEHKDKSEDTVVLKGLIYPDHDNASDLSHYPAGYVSQLADRITELSGFGEPTTEPVTL